MYQKGENKRDIIVRIADQLVYQRGYDHTSYRDISEAAGIPRGNFYHYFKTKDEILIAVINHRIDDIRTMLEQWEIEFPKPFERLKRYVQMIRNSQEGALRYGCPMGSLNTELGKDHPALRDEARKMFDVFHDWLTRQFVLLGKNKQADVLARRLQAYTQGIAVIAHTYADQAFLQEEARELDRWLDELA